MAGNRIPGPLGLTPYVIDDGTLVRSATARPGPLGVHEYPGYSLTSQRDARGSANASGAGDQVAEQADPEVADIVAALHVASEHIAFEGRQLRFVQAEHWTAKQRAEERYQVLSTFEARDIVGRMAASPLVASQMKQALTRAAPWLAEMAAGATRGKLLVLYRIPTVTAHVSASAESITPSQFRRMLGKQNESHSIEFNFETVSGHKISDSHLYFLTHPDGSIETGHLSNGKFRRENVDEGSYRLQFQRFDDVSWDTEEAEGEPLVTMTANTVLFPDGTPVKFAVYRYAPSTEAPLIEATGNVVSDTATAEFQYRQSLHENPGGVFVFVATIGKKRALSSDLTILPYPEETIGWIQQRLKALGHDPGPIDAVSGPRTAGALRDFQSTIPELVESGEADPDTLIELRNGVTGMAVNSTDAGHLEKFGLWATASWWCRHAPPPNATDFTPPLVGAKPVVYLPVKRRGGKDQYTGAQIHIQILEEAKKHLNFDIKSLVGSPVKVDIRNMMRPFDDRNRRVSLPDTKLDAGLWCFINISADTIKSLMDPDGPMNTRVNENLLDFLVEIPAINVDGQPLQGDSTNRLFVYCRKTIVFLPGVFGSEIGLVAKDGEGAGFPHFLNIKILHPTAGFRIGNLECDVKGELVLPAPHPKLFKKAVHFMSVYETFDKVREARRRRLQWVPDEFLVYMLEAFSYDWRGDLTKAAESMMQKLRELQERLRKRDDTDDQVAIAGHSTGGVIIRRMLGEPGADSLISHAFFLNVPFRGAPKALSVMVTGRDPPGGDPMIPGMDPHSMLAIAPTAPIVYHLAPSAKYPTPVAQILPDGIPSGPLPDREREKAALIDAALRRGILHPAAPVCVPLDSLEERLAVADGADDWNDFVRWRNRHSDGDALYQYESEKGGSVGETHFSLPAKKLAESPALQLQAARRIRMAWSTDLAKQAQTFHETSERIAAQGAWAGKAYIFYTKGHRTTVKVTIEPQGTRSSCAPAEMFSTSNTSETFFAGEAKPAAPDEASNKNLLVVEQWQYQGETLWRSHSQVWTNADDGDGTVPLVSLLGFGGPAKVFKHLPGDPAHVPAPNSDWLWSRVMDVLQGDDVSKFLLTTANTTKGTET